MSPPSVVNWERIYHTPAYFSTRFSIGNKHTNFREIVKLNNSLWFPHKLKGGLISQCIHLLSYENGPWTRVVFEWQALLWDILKKWVVPGPKEKKYTRSFWSSLWTKVTVCQLQIQSLYHKIYAVVSNMFEIQHTMRVWGSDIATIIKPILIKRLFLWKLGRKAYIDTLGSPDIPIQWRTGIQHP